QPRRGQDHHRSLAAVLQHREATLVAWIQATGTRGHHLACASKRSSTVICPGNSPKADHELRLKPDHPMGSGHTQGGDPLSRMRFAPIPPVGTLRELVSYDPDTGKLTWNFRKRSFFTSDREYLRWNNRYAGKAAFASKTRGGYLSGAIFKRLYLAHRVAWKIYTGDEPGLILDHINGDRTDNRIANLREATFEQNVGNRLPNADSTSRYRGVAW